jgi:hypothetical protein
LGFFWAAAFDMSLAFDAPLAPTLYLLALGENRQLSSGSEEYFFKKQFS